jgi:hypothetical protein
MPGCSGCLGFQGSEHVSAGINALLGQSLLSTSRKDVGVRRVHRRASDAHRQFEVRLDESKRLAFPRLNARYCEAKQPAAFEIQISRTLHLLTIDVQRAKLLAGVVKCPQEGKGSFEQRLAVLCSAQLNTTGPYDLRRLVDVVTNSGDVCAAMIAKRLLSVEPNGRERVNPGDGECADERDDGGDDCSTANHKHRPPREPLFSDKVQEIVSHGWECINDWQDRQRQTRVREATTGSAPERRTCLGTLRMPPEKSPRI